MDMHSATTIVLIAFALIVLSGGLLTHNAASLRMDKFLSDGVFALLFGAIGTAAYLSYVERERRSIHGLEAGAAFVAGYFILQYLIQLIVK